MAARNLSMDMKYGAKNGTFKDSECRQFKCMRFAQIHAGLVRPFRIGTLLLPQNDAMVRQSCGSMGPTNPIWHEKISIRTRGEAGTTTYQQQDPELPSHLHLAG